MQNSIHKNTPLRGDRERSSKCQCLLMFVALVYTENFCCLSSAWHAHQRKLLLFPFDCCYSFWTRKSKYRDKSRLSAVTESCFPLFLVSWRQISVSTDAPVTNPIHGPGLFCHFMLLNAAFWAISSWGWLLQRGHFISSKPILVTSMSWSQSFW